MIENDHSAGNKSWIHGLEKLRFDLNLYLKVHLGEDKLTSKFQVGSGCSNWKTKTTGMMALYIVPSYLADHDT